MWLLVIGSLTTCLTLVACDSTKPAEQAAGTQCELHGLQVPVNVVGLTPLVTARINDVKARLVLDTGAFFSEISLASAEQYHLEFATTPDPLFAHGIGGTEVLRLLRAKRFELGPNVFSNIELIGIEHRHRLGAVGLLGQSVLGVNDVEYDLANGVIRVFSPPQACKNTSMAYWAGSQPVVVVDMVGAYRRHWHYAVTKASINGKSIRVMLDTGSEYSLISLDAAKRAGLKPGGDGVVPDEDIGGFGPRRVRTWLAPVRSLVIGTEEIRNTQVRFVDATLDVEDDWDMVLGDDYFLAHHIFVANSQRRLYLTHNGGPVFERSLESAHGTPRPEVGGSDVHPPDE